MNTNLKHLDDYFIIEESLKDKSNFNKWVENISVSEKSKFTDNIWELEVSDIYLKLTVDWTKKTKSNFSLLDYPHLLNDTKKVVFLMNTTIATRKKKKSLSQKDIFYHFLYLLDWMISNKIYKYSEFTKKSLTDYVSWLIKNRFKEKNHYEQLLVRYIYPLFQVLTYTEYLDDGLTEDLFDGKLLYDFFEVGIKDTKQTKAIPNEVIEKVCKKILPIVDYFYENKHSTKGISDQRLIIKKDNIRILGKDKKDSYVIDILNGIGYFILGLYTGMRLSELGSLKKNCLEVDSNNVIILNSTLFKLVSSDKGRPEKWGCGINNEQNYAVKIIKILSDLSPTEYNKVFFKYYRNKISHIQVNKFNETLNRLMDFCEVDWTISTHQLRRTFAKLIGITDKTCLLALKEHFKHVSLAMTDYYVGTNYELISMINAEKQQEITDGLESILSSGNLAGKLGEKLKKTNLKFRGNIESRKEYIDDILNNSDLIVVPHEYGFCIYQPEQAKCKGENKNIGLNTCTNCNNFVVSQKHKVFWLNRVEQYQSFKEHIFYLSNQVETVQELDFEINQANSIINKISGKDA